jgi:hypothetical protein
VDLTQLSKQNKGVFPTETAFKTIDGRTAVAGHGGADMPVWGSVFIQSSESSTADGVKARVGALVTYLESIQEKP